MNDGLDPVGRRELKCDDGLGGRRRFGRVPSGTAKTRPPIGAGAAGCLGRAEVCGQQRPPQPIGKLGVAAWQLTRQAVAFDQRLQGDLVGIEPLVVESPGLPGS